MQISSKKQKETVKLRRFLAIEIEMTFISIHSQLLMASGISSQKKININIYVYFHSLDSSTIIITNQ